MEHQVLLDLVVLVVPQELAEHQVYPDHQERLDQLEHQEHLDQLEHLEHLLQFREQQIPMLNSPAQVQ